VIYVVPGLAQLQIDHSSAVAPMTVSKTDDLLAQLRIAIWG
jgi:hypothetical protein